MGYANKSFGLILPGEGKVAIHKLQLCGRWFLLDSSAFGRRGMTGLLKIVNKYWRSSELFFKSELFYPGLLP